MKIERKIRRWTIFMIAGLFVSGLTAIPVQTEVNMIESVFGNNEWISALCTQLRKLNADYPFIFYGFDWLAFAHFALAFLYFGLYKDPVKNEWLVQFGIIVSIAIFPFAFVFGNLRGIPVWWSMIDCMFGVVALIIFIRIKNLINQLKSIL